jgi:hypothetical protein
MNKPEIKYNKGDNAYCIDMDNLIYCEKCFINTFQIVKEIRRRKIENSENIIRSIDFKCKCGQINTFSDYE